MIACILRQILVFFVLVHCTVHWTLIMHLGNECSMLYINLIPHIHHTYIIFHIEKATILCILGKFICILLDYFIFFQETLHLYFKCQ